jgi:hypothetical protein
MDEAFESLLTRTAAPGFKEVGSLTVRSIAFAKHDVLLGLDLREDHQYPNEAACRERWELRCRDVRNTRIESRDGGAMLSYADEHPALLPHTSPVFELYFRGTCDDADRVVGQLFQAHREVVGHWFEFEDFLNGSSPAELLRGGYGRLAAGPKDLIDRYAEVMRRNGVAVSSPPPQPRPPWRREGKIVTEAGPLRALLVGRFCFVTPEVTAKRA